jgi:hypothetical protein
MLKRLLSLFCVGSALALSTGCDNTGCVADCAADCVSDCASDCGACECECDSCEGCSLLPIPGGFPKSERIPNATQVRLSPSGIAFIESQASALVSGLVPGGLSQAIPYTSFSEDFTVGAVDGYVCGNQLVAEWSHSGRLSFAWESGTTNADRTFTPSHSGRAALYGWGGFLNPGRVIVLEDGNEIARDDMFSPGRAVAEFNFVAGRTYTVRLQKNYCYAALDCVASNAVLIGTPAAGCNVKVDLLSLDLNAPEGTNRIDATVTVRATTVNNNGARAALPVTITGAAIGIGLGPTFCSIDLDTQRGTPNVTLTAQVALENRTAGAREGYSRLALLDVTLAENTIEFTDAVASNCIVTTELISSVYDLFIGDLTDTVNQTVEQVQDEIVNLCQPALLNPLNNVRELCPSGSTARTSGGNVYCYGFTDTNNNGIADGGEAVSNQCVEILLGVEQRLDMGDLLSSISPGLRAAIDILFAAQQDGQATQGGYTVNMWGGFNTLQASSCITDLETRLGCPPSSEAAAFRGGEGDDNHISLGLSEEVMNYGAYQLWRSGALCLQVTTRLDQLLSTGLFSVLIGSLNDLAFPSSGAAIGIALRPQQPPVVTLGAGTEEDPFITVALPELALDFYVWSTERYVRFMTFTSDVVAQVNLPLSNGAITPADRARVARQLVGQQQRAHS